VMASDCIRQVTEMSTDDHSTENQIIEMVSNDHGLEMPSIMETSNKN